MIFWYRLWVEARYKIRSLNHSQKQINEVAGIHWKARHLTQPNQGYCHANHQDAMLLDSFLSKVFSCFSFVCVPFLLFCLLFFLSSCPPPLLSVSVSVACSRGVHCDDGPFPPEKEDWLFCDSDIPALHHDSHPFPSVLLAQSGIGSCEDRFRSALFSCFNCVCICVPV